MEKTGMAKHLERLRAERGLTQRALEVLAGLPIGTVAALESGRKAFSDSRVEKMAHALKITEGALLEGAVGDRRLSPAVRKIVEISTPLSESEQHILLGRVMQMIEEGLL